MSCCDFPLLASASAKEITPQPPPAAMQRPPRSIGAKGPAMPARDAGALWTAQVGDGPGAGGKFPHSASPGSEAEPRSKCARRGRGRRRPQDAETGGRRCRQWDGKRSGGGVTTPLATGPPAGGKSPTKSGASASTAASRSVVCQKEDIDPLLGRPSSFNTTTVRV